MRVRVDNGGLTVNAIAGNHAVFLGFDLTDAARAGCLGFAIHRQDLTSHRSKWLSGFKTFKSQVPTPALTTIYSTQRQPIQAMWWGDYTTTPGHRYHYTVLPQYGTPDDLTGKDSVTAQVEVTTDDPDTGTHGIYFNRGVAASQAYATKFGAPPDQLPPARRAAAMRWLSRGLHEALIAYITDGAGPSLALRAAVYQFTEPSVLAAFAQAQAAGADVQVIYHADGDEGQANEVAIQAAVDSAGFDRAAVIPRTHATIAHNKFIVRADKAADGTLSPAQVWTGSTNLSQGGIFGHSNVGHVVRDASVAQAYLDYWGQVAGDPVKPLLRAWTDEHSPFDAGSLGDPGVHPLFSPRTALDPLNWYATGFATSPASTSITLPFGLDDAHFEAQLAAAHTPGVLRFVLLDSRDNHQDIWSTDRMVQVAVGATGSPQALSSWAAEQLTGFNLHARYLHTKILLVDPLGQVPVTVSGSANFSSASTISNDENMLVITGDTEVADVYFAEFQRIFDHFYARWWAQRLRKRAPEAHDYLTEDDSWLEPYYKPGTPKSARRILYAGTGG
ncbi:phospholipase D-like domain-containing protein [Jatrophihabitans sp.]|uniref:phospholipase D-like domain-containing protein n=1 Tax=Jatrophihabitans sp. TaxID=1932789 RepID=UPI002BF63685|nr:phospholipase D-like domain-containing protein [Jatrophihabitans sp.]